MGVKLIKVQIVEGGEVYMVQPGNDMDVERVISGDGSNGGR